MPNIEDLINDLTELPDTVQDGVDRAIIGDSVDITDVNREQMAKGLDINDKPFGDYAESTKAIRKRKGLQTAFIDLNFTGKSSKSLTTKKQSDSNFTIEANPRWDQKRFPDAIGISKEGENDVTDIIVENIEALLDQKFKK